MLRSCWPRLLTRGSRCVFCLSTPAHYGCCPDCRNDLPLIGRACRLCAAPLREEKEWLDLCAACLQQKKDPLIDYAFSAYHYIPPLRKALHYLKFNHQLYYAPVMGRLWLEVLQRKSFPFMPDLLIPVPLYISRLRRRGFNQTTELAKPLAAELSLPLAENICRRQRDTLPQMSCALSARKSNVKDAFALRSVDIRRKSVAILDDVLTTGATIHELARVLKKGGVRRIAVWTFLRS